MSVTALSVVGHPVATVRLIDTAVSVPALISHIRPALVLAEADARQLIQAADSHGVRTGGHFLAGPLGIQLWSGPFDGPDGTPGSALHFGSIDWSYDTPVKHYATIYRSTVTTAGVNAGETTASVLARVLALCGIGAGGERVTVPIPPPRDPFRRRAS